MYQALYRVWRPATFSDMVGQEAVRKTLRNQVRTGRIAHAYLFCGSRGTGKTSAAKIMARAINCLNPQDGDPCGECESCKTLLNDASLDVYEMDAASNSRVEEIRELLEKVDYPPQFGKYKVYIIDEVHMLSNAAFNALLKTLEEPPAYMVFILATTEPQKLPATILSRCQRFDFGRLSEEDIVSRLHQATDKADVPVDEEALLLIAQAAEGGMRDAWSLLDMCLGTGEAVTADAVRRALGAADGETLFALADAVAASDSAAALRLCGDMMRQGRDVTVFLKDFSAHLRKLMACRLCGGNDALPGVTPATARRLSEQAALFSEERLLRALNLTMKAESDTRWAASPRSVLEVCMLSACEKAAGNDLSSLLERVAELERRLDGIESGRVAVAARPAAGGEPSGAKTAAAPAAPAKKAPPREGAGVWNDAMKLLSKSAPAVFAPMAQGVFDGCEEHVYRLSFPPESADFFIPMLSSAEHRETVEQALREAGDTEARFEVRAAGRATDADRERRVRQNADALIDTFGRDKVQIEE